MTAQHKYTVAALAAMLVFAGPAFAQNENSAQDMQAQSPSSSGVPMYSGGIGDDEIAYIHSVQVQYNTKLLFTEGNGEYLADLPVNIRNKSGETVLSTVTNGPILLVNLPAGSYVVSASDNGVNREQKVTVGEGKHQTLHFTFPGHDLDSQGY